MNMITPSIMYVCTICVRINKYPYICSKCGKPVTLKTCSNTWQLYGFYTNKLIDKITLILDNLLT